MACYELKSGCCGCPVRSMVCIGLCHYMLFGLFTVCFVFTNVCYPPYSIPDYLFGGFGAVLLVISFLTALTVDLKKYQFLRVFMASLTILSIMGTVACCYYYTITRWDDVIVTLIVYSIRAPALKDFPDYFWYTLVVISCISGPVLLFYIIYIISFMFNKWKSHLFTAPYQNNVFYSSLPATMTMPRDDYSTRAYKPYPVQGS